MEDSPLINTVDIDLYGKTMTLETGRVAKQANGAVVVKTGDNVLVSGIKSGSTVTAKHVLDGR